MCEAKKRILRLVYFKKIISYAMIIGVIIGVSRADIGNASDSISRTRNKNGTYSTIIIKNNRAYSQDGKLMNNVDINKTTIISPIYPESGGNSPENIMSIELTWHNPATGPDAIACQHEYVAEGLLIDGGCSGYNNFGGYFDFGDIIVAINGKTFQKGMLKKIVNDVLKRRKKDAIITVKSRYGDIKYYKLINER